MQIGGNTRPVRVRVLDLPFTAVEWVLPSDMLHAGGDPLTPSKWMVWDRSPLAKERSLAVSPFCTDCPCNELCFPRVLCNLDASPHAAPVSSPHKGMDVVELYCCLCVCLDMHLSINTLLLFCYVHIQC